MSACHSSERATALLEDRGGDSSMRRVEPHSLVVQKGASRSGAGGERERSAARLFALRRLGWDSWYLSGKRAAGRVR